MFDIHSVKASMSLACIGGEFDRLSIVPDRIRSLSLNRDALRYEVILYLPSLHSLLLRVGEYYRTSFFKGGKYRDTSHFILCKEPGIA